MSTSPYSQGHFGIRLFQPERDFVCEVCGQPGKTRARQIKVHPGKCKAEWERRRKERKKAA